MRGALLAIALLGLLGCPEDSPDNVSDERGSSKRSSNSYVNDEHDFSIDFPADWKVQEGFMGSVVFAATAPSGVGDTIAENINIVMERTPGVSAAQYWRRASLAMDQMLTDLERGESGSETIDGQEAPWLVYSHRMGQMSFQALAYALVDDGRAFVITCTATPETYARYEAQFRKIVRTFRFE